MSTRLVQLLTILTLSAPACFSSAVLISGNAMNAGNTMLTGNLAQLAGSNSFTFVAPGNFAATSLAGYNLVWLDGFSQYLSLASLATYLNDGGTVLVQNPGFGSEPLASYPDSTGLGASFTGGGNTVHILLPGDFLNVGLTDGGLSNWSTFSDYGNFTSISSDFISLSNDGVSGEDVTIRTTGGPGLLVYTQQGIAQYLSNQSLGPNAAPLQLLDNLVGTPEPGTGALLMMSLCVLGGIRARKLR